MGFCDFLFRQDSHGTDGQIDLKKIRPLFAVLIEYLSSVNAKNLDEQLVYQISSFLTVQVTAFTYCRNTDLATVPQLYLNRDSFEDDTGWGTVRNG